MTVRPGSTRRKFNIRSLKAIARVVLVGSVGVVGDAAAIDPDCGKGTFYRTSDFQCGVDDVDNNCGASNPSA